MPPPFLSYLRVYEPLRAFGGSAGAPVRAAVRRGALSAEVAGARDRELCLRAQLRSRLLPEPRTEVLVTTGAGGRQLVCPLDTRPRAGAALLAFLTVELPVLPAAALPVPAREARREAEAAVAELGDGAAHVVSSSWTVPLPWFALVHQDERRVAFSPRRVWWQVPVQDALRRAARAEEVLRAGLGDGGPAEILSETAAWLQRFDRDSVLELDYGGLVELLTDAALRSDTCAAQVHAAIEALRTGDGEAAAAGYERLREFLSATSGRERAC